MVNLSFLVDFYIAKSPQFTLSILFAFPILADSQQRLFTAISCLLYVQKVLLWFEVLPMKRI
jgi:hypothetical protein